MIEIALRATDFQVALCEIRPDKYFIAFPTRISPLALSGNKEKKS